MRSKQKASFATQYTSLMLIILSVVVSSRFQLDMPARAHAVEKVALRPDSNSDTLGVLHYEDLFVSKHHRLNTNTAAAIASVVSQHDVNARLSIYLPVEEFLGDESKALGVALARAVSAHSFFSEMTPLGSIHIEVLEEPGGTLVEAVQASVQFAGTKEGVHGN